MKKLLLGIYIFIFITSSCTTLRVNHLRKNPWVIDKPQVLEMNYLEFHYTIYHMNESVYVIGKAYPIFKKLPPWGIWIDEIWLGVYLSDSHGKVLAQDINILPPQKISKSGFPFNFVIKPTRFGSPGPIYITFGYRLKITNFPFQKHKVKPKIFFAIEQAQDIP